MEQRQSQQFNGTAANRDGKKHIWSKNVTPCKLTSPTHTVLGDLFRFSTSAFDLKMFCLSQLIPLFILIGIGGTGLCTMRLALRNPDLR
ncbi:Hypothetical predicted protein [Podarcis lilfordi]|nr:Hypothetical predicted protein [Podarcis lilfordi]